MPTIIETAEYVELTTPADPSWEGTHVYNLLLHDPPTGFHQRYLLTYVDPISLTYLQHAVARHYMCPVLTQMHWPLACCLGNRASLSPALRLKVPFFWVESQMSYVVVAR